MALATTVLLLLPLLDPLVMRAGLQSQLVWHAILSEGCCCSMDLGSSLSVMQLCRQ
jgi:hypothetical protein